MGKLIHTTLVMLVALVVVGGLAFATIGAWQRAQSSGTFYTDNAQTDTIREPASAASPSDILWKPATALARGINSPSNDLDPGLSADGTVLFFSRASERGDSDMYFVQRSGFGWSKPVPLDAINSDRDDLGPQPTHDGTAIVFASNRAGGSGGYDLWMSRRTDDGWLPPENLGTDVNTVYHEYAPAVSPDSTTLVFASNRPDVMPDALENAGSGMFQGDFDLYTAQLINGSVADTHMLVSLSTNFDDISPAFSPAGDFVYFSSDRLDSFGGFDIFRARIIAQRDVPSGSPDSDSSDALNTDAPVEETLETLLARDGFSSVVNLGPSVNADTNELDPTLSFDGFELHFTSDRAAWVAPDGTVDGGSVSYDIYRTVAREVVTEYDAGQARLSFMDWINRVWPMVAVVLLLLVMLALMGWLRTTEMWAKRWKPLSLIAKCFIISAIAHMLLAGGMAVWSVSGALDGTAETDIGSRTPIVVRSVSSDISQQLRGTMAEIEIATADSPQTPQAEQAEITPLDVAAAQMTPDAVQAEAAEAIEQQQPVDTSVSNPQMVAQAEAAVPETEQVDSAEPTPDAAVATSEQALETVAQADTHTPRAESDAPTPMDVASTALNPEAVQAGPAEAFEQTQATDTTATNPQMTAQAESKLPQSEQLSSAEPTPDAAMATSEQAIQTVASADSHTPRAQSDAPAPMDVTSTSLNPEAVQVGPAQTFATPESTDTTVDGPRMVADAPVSKLPSTADVTASTPNTQAAVAQAEIALHTVPTGVDPTTVARATTDAPQPMAVESTTLTPSQVQAQADEKLATETEVAESAAATDLPETAIADIANPAALAPMTLTPFDTTLHQDTVTANTTEQELAAAPQDAMEIAPAELTTTESFAPMANTSLAIEDLGAPSPIDPLSSDMFADVAASTDTSLDIPLPMFSEEAFDAPDAPALAELDDVNLPTADDAAEPNETPPDEPSTALADAGMVPLPALHADIEHASLTTGATGRDELEPRTLDEEFTEMLTEQAYTPDAMPEFDIMPLPMTELGSVPLPADESFDIALPTESVEPEPSADPEKIPGRIIGMVIDARTRRPLRGALVKLDLDGDASLEYSTNANGQFELEPDDLPEHVAVTASAKDYTPESTNIRSEDVQRGVRVVFMLAPIDENVVVVETDPEVHHLGNDEFSGQINSQFQKRSEGLRWKHEFTLTENQIGDDLSRAELRLLARGTQAPNEIWINGRLLPKRLDGSPRDGSFGQFRANVPAEWLELGDNEIDIRSRRGTADLDDFEFVNVQFHLRRRQQFTPTRRGGRGLE